MSRAALKRLLGDRTGVSAIEFGILAPVLFTLLLGTLDFARMFYIRQGMENATEQALRYYMLNPAALQSDVTTQLTTAMVGGMGPQLSVAYADTTSCNSNRYATCTTITVTYPFHFVAGFLGLGDKTLTATGQTVRWNCPNNFCQ
jgi:Flp pilus assembly protein TadG